VSTPLVIAVVWALTPILVVLAIFGLCEWFDRRRQHANEQRLILLCLESAWDAEAYEREQR
jgi:hypothetical protein